MSDLEWVAVRAEREGTIERLSVEKGRAVAKGAVLAELDTKDARTALASAEARVAQVRAEIEGLDRGGRPAEMFVQVLP